MILYGAGGHAHVVKESLRSTAITILGVFDDNRDIQFFEGLKVEHAYNPGLWTHEKIIITIGSNEKRYERSKNVEHNFGICIDISSAVSDSALVDVGTMIMARAIIQSSSKIGKHVIINTGAIVDHHCVIDDFVHIGPGSVVCGNVKVGKGALIGANSTILPGVSIGDWATIGAGSVVIKNINPGEKVAGNPAKSISGK